MTAKWEVYLAVLAPVFGLGLGSALLAIFTGHGSTAAMIVVPLLFSLIAYVAPTVIAAARGVPNLGSVAVINLLLGWTFIGWVVALAMACASVAAPVAVVAVPHLVAVRDRVRFER